MTTQPQQHTTVDEILASGDESAPRARRISIGRRFAPRCETAMLLAGLAATLLVKYVVVSDRPYESLATLLRSAGYRTRFS